VTVSIGGVSLPRYGRTVTDALARAQESLHSARSRGHGRFAAYQASPQRDAQRRANAAVSSEMVAALEANQLKLHLQPVVGVARREPRFYEALLRLERSDGTITAAHEFIELSEQLGLIRIIDRYALEQTLALLKQTSDVTLSLNVSGETVGDAEWFSNLATAVSGDRKIAERLIVEITETAVIKNLEEASNSIATLHDLGCRVAIDDFGAGFSSFKHLRALDVDIVKIAGEFVDKLPASPDDQVFVRALVDLTRAFDIQIVAEWVEDEATAKLLATFGVDMMQGNYCGIASADWLTARPAAGAQKARS
jgi:EAL domain-containing protein (putative c-di-GMP-specific phosphodiesterase class I)